MNSVRKLQPAGYSFTSYCYEEFQVILVQKGQLTLTVHETDFNLESGSLALLRTGSCFTLSSQEGYRGLGLIDKGDRPAAFHGKATGLPASSQVRMSAELIEHYLLLPDAQSRHILDALAEAMAWQVLDLERKRQAYAPAWPDVIQAVLDINLGTGIPAREALNHLPLSYRQISRIFLADRGITPKQYLLEARIREAQRLLSQSQLSITAIAMELGFASSQHLSTQFKAATGLTPREYRCAEHRTSNSERSTSK